MSEIAIDGNELEIDGTDITVPDEISDVLEIAGLVIIRQRSLGRDASVGNRNIWAFDRDGAKLWEVEEEPPAGNNTENPFISIWEEKGGLWTRCWNNHEHRVDLQTGNLVEQRAYR